MGDVRRFLWVGGHVAIDFVNTLGGRPDNADDEYLHHYEDLLVWTEQAQLLPSVAAGHLRSAAGHDRIAADAALQDAKVLRKSLDRLLRGTMPDRKLPRHTAEAAAVHQAYLGAVAAGALQPDGLHLLWEWPTDTDDLRRPLWPVAFAAVGLLQQAPLDRLAQCQHCRWLFLDASPQHNRRWCSMNACGAISKMRRYRTGLRTLRPSSEQGSGPGR